MKAWEIWFRLRRGLTASKPLILFVSLFTFGCFGAESSMKVAAGAVNSLGLALLPKIANPEQNALLSP